MAMNEYIQLSDEVIMTDFEGKEFIIMRMYCNITANKNINFSYDILMESAYATNKDMCNQRVADFRTACEARARDAGVPIF